MNMVFIQINYKFNRELKLEKYTFNFMRKEVDFVVIIITNSDGLK